MDSSIQKNKANKSNRESQTLFRSVYGNQNSQIKIADGKANMIIGINTLIISSIIAISGYGLMSDSSIEYPQLTLVSIVLIMISCTLSTYLAVESIRPRIVINKAHKNPDIKSSMLFFGEINKYSQVEYLSKMQELLTSKNDIYEQMTLDIYHQGKILHKKYRFLGYSYTIFIVGFILSVAIFIYSII